jgi:hypothetical protein
MDDRLDIGGKDSVDAFFLCLGFLFLGRSLMDDIVTQVSESSSNRSCPTSHALSPLRALGWRPPESPGRQIHTVRKEH